MNKPANVMFIVLDTLRLDTIYNNLKRFPAFSKLAEISTVFNSAISTASWTVPSHASMFTGMYLNEHGIHASFNNNMLLDSVRKFPDRCRPLPSVFRKAGYNTNSVVNNNMLGKGTAFEDGFDRVESVGPFVLQEKYREKMKEIVGADNLDAVESLSAGDSKMKLVRAVGAAKALKLAKMHREWSNEWKGFGYPEKKGAVEALDSIISANLKEPFFSFVNLMEAHEPYHNSIDFSRMVRYYSVGALTKQWPNREQMESELGKMRKSLYSNVENLDRFFSGLINHLKEKGLYENTAIMVVSDHGQCFGEDDYVGHGYLLNDYLVKVPMMLKQPGSDRKESDIHVSTSDIYGVLSSLAEGNPGYFPERDYVFSESYGVSEATWKKQLGDIYKDYMPMVRKRIWSSDGYSLLVNGSTGEIEDFSFRGRLERPADHRDVVSDLLTELSIFTGNEDFRIPEFGA